MLTRRLQQATRCCSFQSPVVTRRQQPRHSCCRCRRDLSTRLCDQCVNCLQLVKVWKSLSLCEMCVMYLFPLTLPLSAHWHCLVIAGAEGSFSRTQRVINNRRWVWFNAVAVYKWNFLVAAASAPTLTLTLNTALTPRLPCPASTASSQNSSQPESFVQGFGQRKLLNVFASAVCK